MPDLPDLTKRSSRLAAVAPDLFWPSNIGMGVSVENDLVVHRIDDFRRVPAHIRFFSIEPLLGPLPNANLTDIH